MEKVTRIGMDTSKRFFQLHGVDANEQVALRRQLTRAQALPFFERLRRRWWRWKRAGRRIIGPAS